MEEKKYKSTEEIDAIREKLRSDNRARNFADTMIDPNTPEGKQKLENWQRAGVEASVKARKIKRERDARIKEKAEGMAETLESINQVAQTPGDVMKLLMHEAMLEGDTETAFKIAKELKEYEQPKLSRVESINKDKGLEALTPEELKELAKLKEELE